MFNNIHFRIKNDNHRDIKDKYTFESYMFTFHLYTLRLNLHLIDLRRLHQPLV